MWWWPKLPYVCTYAPDCSPWLGLEHNVDKDFVNKILDKLNSNENIGLISSNTENKISIRSVLPCIFSSVFHDGTKNNKLIQNASTKLTHKASLAMFIKTKHHYSLLSLFTRTGLLLARTSGICYICHSAFWYFMFESEASLETRMSVHDH